MRWTDFELLVGEAYRRLGYRVLEMGQGGADGGIDLTIEKDGELTLVQCKQWRNQRIGVTVVREMFGLMVHHRAGAVKIVCTGRFTPEAIAFAKGKQIELVDGDRLLRLVEDLRIGRTDARARPGPLGVQPSVLEPPPPPSLAPECPRCRLPMLRRKNRSTGAPFWGCPNFPGCRATVPISDA